MKIKGYVNIYVVLGCGAISKILMFDGHYWDSIREKLRCQEAAGKARWQVVVHLKDGNMILEAKRDMVDIEVTDKLLPDS